MAIGHSAQMAWHSFYCTLILAGRRSFSIVWIIIFFIKYRINVNHREHEDHEEDQKLKKYKNICFFVPFVSFVVKKSH